MINPVTRSFTLTFKIPQIFSVLTHLNSWKVFSCV